MFHSQNTQLAPNMLASTAEQDEEERRLRKKVIQDATNKSSKNNNKPYRSFKGQSDKENVGKDFQQSKYNKGDQSQQLASKRANLIIEFDSDESSEELQDDSNGKESNHSSKVQKEQQQYKNEQPLIAQKKNPFLLTFNSEDSIGEEESQLQEQTKVEDQNISETKITQHQKQLLLDLSLSDQQQEVSEGEKNKKEQQILFKTTIRLSELISELKEAYYCLPIPKGRVFQCVMKRDRCQSILKYHLYDSLTLRNFITVIKDEEGYLIISKGDSTKPYNNAPKQRVIGRVTSNFFGTQFNCLLEESVYRRGKQYPVNERAERAITIQYETNFFGLRGPRKMTAYIPVSRQQTYCEGLNKIYSKQKKDRSVLRFKNKTPKWNSQLQAYVLNFSGRATVSSQDEQKKISQKVLFGKFGKQLFNLDVRHPFSLVQALSLALSSFDRKLACE